jgi:hypothetical protein
MSVTKTFSLPVLVATATVTAVISATVGGSIGKFLERSRPSISLLSVGFQAPNQKESVRLPDDTSNLSKQAHWAISLERFEPFARLLEVEQRNRSWVQEANELIANMEEWKARYIARGNSTYLLSDGLSAAAVLGHPYLSSDTGGGVITVLLRRGLFGKVTYGAKDVETITRIIDISDQKAQNRWALFLGHKVQLLPYDNSSDSAKAAIDLFVQSLARGVTQNVVEYTDYAIALTRKDILDAQRISAAIEEATLPNATIAITVALHNAGKTPVTFGPYFGLRIDHPDYVNQNLTLVASDSEHDRSNPFALTADGFTINLGDREKKGERTRVDPFLPNAGSVGYLNVPGGETVRAKLVGTSALGPRAKTLVEMHATKLLRASVVGLTGAGSEIWSPLTQFSLSVDDVVKKRLESAQP